MGQNTCVWVQRLCGGSNGKSSLSGEHPLLNHYILTSFSQAVCVKTHLHPNDGVDEEQHGNEQADIRQSLNTNTNTG